MPRSASRARRRRRKLTFFVDRSLGGKKVVACLRDADCDARAHDAMFPQDAPDSQWLRVVGKRGWLVLTGDKRLRWNDAELAAIYYAGASVFMLSMKEDRTAERIGSAVVRALKRIESFVSKVSAPFVASINCNGSVDVRFTAIQMKEILDRGL